jgi:uncharacterized membrane protein YkoI
MTNKLKGALIAAAMIAALAGGGAAIAGATGGDDSSSSSSSSSDKPITGSALDRAKAVALQQTGGGRVTDTELRDEEGYYEIEVRRDDGSQVDVHLDRNFNVLDAAADGGSDGSDGPNNG